VKKFNFRLQRVLNYRNVLKKEEQRNLAQRNHELKEAEQLRDEILQAQDQNVLAEENVTMAEFKIRKEYGEVLHQALVEQRLLVLQAADAVDRARMLYIERSVESETLETLKDKKRETYKEEIRKEEMKDLNERTVQQYSRKKQTSNEGEDNG